MDIKDFLPKYPNVEKSKYDVLNPYEEDFYKAIFRKKEFYENKLDRVETFPKERGMHTKYQKTVARYFSSNTPYDVLLLVHFMGSGKTCTAIGAIEQIINENGIDGKPLFNGALILGKGKGILENFVTELAEKCTQGQYIPTNYEKLSAQEKRNRIKKKASFYKFKTFVTFAKSIKRMKDEEIVELYSNKIIVLDEVHNLRIQAEKKKETLETYMQFHRFLHLVKNCKILMLSGTPMKDSPEELASIANLILPKDDQFPTGEEFLNEYMKKENGVYKVREEKKAEIKRKLKGKISFLREAESTIQRDYIGEKNFGKLKHFIVAPNQMSSFQTEHYKKAYEKDTGGQKQGIFINCRQASLFVFPDGSYGREGFAKYITEEKGKEKGDMPKYKMTSELKKALKGSSDAETLKNINKCSATYAQVISEILNTDGNCFVYSSFAKGSGCILFSLLLELFSFSMAGGRERDKKLRYAILTNKSATSSQIRKITGEFNKPRNAKGEYIKVIIGSKAVAEGFTFKNVIFEAINTPHWNYSETAQALARGIRLGSHNDLYDMGENPIVKILQPVSMPRGYSTDMPRGYSDHSVDISRGSKKSKGLVSIDLMMYELSEDKDISISAILRLLMENAFDCALNYLRNSISGAAAVPGSRQCYYGECDFTCDGFSASDQLILDEEELDYSTYQLYYANPRVQLIRSKIEKIIRESYISDIDSVVNSLKGQFAEEEIRNVLFMLTEKSKEGEFDYTSFLEIYSRTDVKKIANRLEEIFKNKFQTSFEDIKSDVKLSSYKEFELLSSLQNIINDNLILLDKYGLPCYLREQKNYYFLVSSMSIKPDFFTEYYVRYPHIVAGKSFEDSTKDVYNTMLPKLVQKICESSDKEFSKLIKILPRYAQEFFIEGSIIAQEQDPEGATTNTEVRERILNFFKGYIKKLGNTTISTLMEQDGYLRCKDDGDSEWRDCDLDMKSLIFQEEEKIREKVKEENKYGIIGKYNPETGQFCIVDFKREEMSKAKAGKVREKGTQDKRTTYTGKVCTSWHIPDLMDLTINRLNIPPPDNFRKGESREVLLDAAMDEKEILKLFSKDDLKSFDRKKLKQILYWGSKKKGGVRSLKDLCTNIKPWMEAQGLVEIDTQCGVAAKKKVGVVKKSQEKEYNFREERATTAEEIKANAQFISPIITEMFGGSKFVPPTNGTWLLAFLRKKIVACLFVNNKNEIEYIGVVRNYRRDKVPHSAMKFFKEILSFMGNSIPLRTTLSNREKKNVTIIKMYQRWGFVVEKTTDNYTTLVYP